MNIIIPMGGTGSRFAAHGYRPPKPLIPIAGRPMLIWILSNLNFRPDDTLFLAVRPELETRHKLSARVREAFPRLHVLTIVLERDTRGAAETLYMVTRQMSRAQLARRTISLDCDTIYFSDALSPFRSLPGGSGCCLYFEDDQADPIFSYIAFREAAVDSRADDDAQGPASEAAAGNGPHSKLICGIAEKVRISSHANTGAYGFGSASTLQKYLLATLQAGVPAVGEYYTSSVISRMLADQHPFYALHASDFACVGTVPQLEAFLQTLRSTRPALSPPQAFCFALEGTLLLPPRAPGRAPAPCARAVAVARELLQCGHAVTVLAPTADRPARAALRALGLGHARLRAGVRPEADGCLVEGSGDGDDSVARRIGWAC